VKVEELVDRFVKLVNAGPREPMALGEVPELLQDGKSDGVSVGWKIVKIDNSDRIAALERRLPKRFPPSFRYFVSHYSFPAFETPEFMLFANTGEDNLWELGKRIFSDPHMSAALLKAGFVQIGNPFFYNYDPVCFHNVGQERAIVQLDHESALQFGETRIVKEVAPSFIVALNNIVTTLEA